MSRTPQLLLLSSSGEMVNQWAEMLRDSGCEVFVDPESLRDDLELDVVVTNEPIVGTLAMSHHQGLANGDIGVVAFGTTLPADVALPRNCTGRELRLACRLLTEVVRLRRERRQEQRRKRVLSHLAHSDPLTGLGNRRAWDKEVSTRIHDARHSNRILGLAVFDIDHFKQVNDQLGYCEGDHILRKIAYKLGALGKETEFIARIGGDEFSMLTHAEHADEVIARVEQVRGQVKHVDDRLGTLELTAGVAGWSPQQSAADLLDAADSALRQAKSQGRNVTVAHASLLLVRE